MNEPRSSSRSTAPVDRPAPSLLYSVIIPSYGRPDHLRTCLEAIGRQDLPAAQFEVIVVDDHSPAPVELALRGLSIASPLTVLRLDHNVGSAEARNRGAEIARGRFLAFIDDDCAPDSGWLSELQAELTMPDHPAVGGRIVNALPDNAFARASDVLSHEVYSLYESDPCRICFLSTASLAVPADRFRQLGGFLASFRVTYEDREFCDRWRGNGFRLAYCPDAVVMHRRAMTLGDFVRQHRQYGRGACRYYRQAGHVVRQGLRGLPGLFLFLSGCVYRREGVRGVFNFAVLFVVSQTAGLWGYLEERLVPGAPRSGSRSSGGLTSPR